MRNRPRSIYTLIFIGAGIVFAIGDVTASAIVAGIFTVVNTVVTIVMNNRNKRAIDRNQNAINENTTAHNKARKAANESAKAMLELNKDETQ
jgi:uncharacterized membrane protein YciS (DUF1049 family)